MKRLTCLTCLRRDHQGGSRIRGGQSIGERVVRPQRASAHFREMKINPKSSHKRGRRQVAMVLKPQRVERRVARATRRRHQSQSSNQRSLSHSQQRLRHLSRSLQSHSLKSHSLQSHSHQRPIIQSLIHRCHNTLECTLRGELLTMTGTGYQQGQSTATDPLQCIDTSSPCTHRGQPPTTTGTASQQATSTTDLSAEIN